MTSSASRILRAAALGLSAAGLVLAAAVAAPEVGPPSEPPLRPAAFPGAPAPGLKYFRINPAARDTLYRLLVIPVRFREDGTLGAGEEEGLAARLMGEGPGTLEGFYRAITFERMRMQVTLAPTVVTDHERAWYTAEGENNSGYGVDMDAYPHNARGLVEEVTARIATAVDLRSFDNTRDGIVDGLLVLHSGPPAPEVITPDLPPTVMLAHSFTLPAPMVRGDSHVFPYSIAATRDVLGPWAHETGHLFGLPDLYVSGFIPGPGLGDWSLMATGAVRDGGADPAGFDAYSLQLLGFEPVLANGATTALALGEGRILRAFRAGEAQGSEYFLVERRDPRWEPGVDAPAGVVYAVDETAVDNRNGERPLVEVRAVTCTGGDDCAAVLTDYTSPSLRDRQGGATGLVLQFAGESVSQSYVVRPSSLRLESVGLLDVTSDPSGLEIHQPVVLTVRNLAPLGHAAIPFGLASVETEPLCTAAPDGIPTYAIPPGAVVRDTSWVIRACSGSGLPARAERFVITLGWPSDPLAPVDTLWLAVNQEGLAAERLEDFASASRDPGRVDPWAWSATRGEWVADSLRALADADLVSPWFHVPQRGSLLFDHRWVLDALVPDVALDAAQVLLDTQLDPDLPLAPTLGWGHTVERGVGNALGGLDALSGSGLRPHAFDLSAHAGLTVRLKWRVAGDVEGARGLWRILDARVAGAVLPGGFTLVLRDDGLLEAVAEGPVPLETDLVLYSGPVPTTPTTLLRRSSWTGSFVVEPDGAPGSRRRFDLVWFAVDGSAGSSELVMDIPADESVLLPASPNPARVGEGQTWNLTVSDRASPGEYTFTLVNVAGRRVFTTGVRYAEPGVRGYRWDGRDDAGSPVAGGVYFLQCRRPDGAVEYRKLVVLP